MVGRDLLVWPFKIQFTRTSLNGLMRQFRKACISGFTGKGESITGIAHYGPRLALFRYTVVLSYLFYN